MTSPAKIAANRENALRSTGPRTLEGKAASSANAVRHGLLSTKALLRDEDPEQFAALAGGLRAALQPQGTLEEQLVSILIHSAWRMKRLPAVESGIIDLERADGATPGGLGMTWLRAGGRGAEAMSKLARYESHLQRSFYRSLHELQRLGAARKGQMVPPPVVADVDVAVSGGALIPG